MKTKLMAMPEEELDPIHSATLNVLKEVGVKFPDETALKTLEKVGAEIDRRNMVARIPEQAVKEALKHYSNRGPSLLALS
ncbi:hypothetical protein GWO13_07785 [Candidatus Bathyarchaeota archaeon]|nr:hypothetical protein [Candidatus Bathyarchaeota archaeon]